MNWIESGGYTQREIQLEGNNLHRAHIWQLEIGKDIARPLHRLILLAMFDHACPITFEPKLPVDSLAKLVGCTPAAAMDAIAEMEASGVIQAYGSGVFGMGRFTAELHCSACRRFVDADLGGS